MSVQQEHLSRQVDEQRQMTHAISQPAIHTGICFLLFLTALYRPCNFCALRFIFSKEFFF